MQCILTHSRIFSAVTVNMEKKSLLKTRFAFEEFLVICHLE